MTMATHRLMNKLAVRDVELWADGETLRYRAPRGVMTPEHHRATTRTQNCDSRASPPLAGDRRDGKRRARPALALDCRAELRHTPDTRTAHRPYGYRGSDSLATTDRTRAPTSPRDELENSGSLTRILDAFDFSSPSLT